MERDAHITWRPISEAQFGATFAALGGAYTNGGMLAAFETASLDTYWLTVWGIRGSDVPLLRFETHGRRDDPEARNTWAIAIVDLALYLRENGE